MADITMVSPSGAPGLAGPAGPTGGAAAQGINADCHWDGDDPAAAGGPGFPGGAGSNGGNGGDAPPPYDLVIRLHDLIGTIRATNLGGKRRRWRARR
ncbi:MAG: hypothetical protein ACP5U2_15885 [Bryobacteraceae bacterium]